MLKLKAFCFIRVVDSLFRCSGPDLQHLLLKEVFHIFDNIQGGFFNWPPLEFTKCWPVSNRFKKNGRVPDWPPLMIEKSLSA